jgi:hypothetical protein
MTNEQVRLRIIDKAQRSDGHEEKANNLPLRGSGAVRRNRTGPSSEDNGGEDELEVLEQEPAKKARAEEAENDKTATSSHPSHIENASMASTPADYVEVDAAQVALMVRAALDQHNSQTLSEGDTAENSDEQPPPNQMSSAPDILDGYRTAVEEYEIRLQMAREIIQDLKDDVKRREQAGKDTAKATETLQRMAASTIEKRNKQIGTLGAIYKELFTTEHLHLARIEKLESDVRQRDITIEDLQEKVRMLEESQQSSESRHKA